MSPSPAASAAERPVVIDAADGWRPVDFAEAWRARELLVVLALRDLRARYKQTVLGIGWVFFQPLALVVVFSGIFRLLLGPDRLPAAAGVPYALSTCCAIVPWTLFSAAVGRAATSLVDDRPLVTRVYFPRVLVPEAPLVAALVDFAVGAGFVALVFVWYHATGVYVFQPRWALLTLPFFTGFAALTAFAVGIWAAALNAIYRDVRYTMPFLLQLLMYLTPVVYAADAVRPRLPAWAAALWGLNPMVGVVEGFRWALLAETDPPLVATVLGLGVVAALLVGGAFVFRRLERVFADVV
jgi:lipopolysaccharide transport system permease protein